MDIVVLIQTWIKDPLVYPLYLGFLLAAGLVLIAVAKSLTSTPRTFSWQRLGEWADTYLGPLTLLAVLGLIIWLAGIGAPDDGAVKLIVTGLDALYIGAVVTYDTTLAAKFASTFSTTPPPA